MVTQAGVLVENSMIMSPAVPKKIHRPSVEYAIVGHCNLQCAGCDHYSGHYEKDYISLEEIKEDVLALSKVMTCDTVRILGGEPLLHPQLTEILQCVKASGLANSTILITNGLLMHRAKPETLDLIDILRISKYPSIRIKVSLEDIEKLANKHDFQIDNRTINRFCLTHLKNPIEDRRLVKKIYTSCKTTHVWSCHTIHKGYYYKCSRVPFISYAQRRWGDDPSRGDRMIKDDGIPLHKNLHLYNDLVNYLEDKEPLFACSFCLGTSGKKFPHRQYTKLELKQSPLSDKSANEQLANTTDRLKEKTINMINKTREILSI